MKKRPLVIAHRGASAYKKENTLAAFLLAKKIRADRIEMDIRSTKDRFFVVQHSRGVGKGRKRRWVDKLTLSEIKELDAHPLLLEKVLDRLSSLKIGIELDLKDSGGEKELVSLIKKKKIKKITFKSNNGWQLVKLKNLLPSAETVLYYEPPDKKDITSRRWSRLILFGIGFLLSLPIRKILPHFLGRAITFGADGVSLYHRFCTQKMVEDLHEEGIKVYIWGLEKERNIKKVLRWGVDGIITKRPDLLRKMLAEK